MKLNFWQYLGLFIFVIALVVIIKRELGPDEKKPETTTPAPAPAM